MPSWELLPILLALVLQEHPADLPAYTVGPTAAAPTALLAGDDDAWERANAIAWGDAPFVTRFRALRANDGLWLRWNAADRDPWHTLTERDDPIWNEEVVEIFLDPDGDGRDYVEIEISPAGVVTDLLVAQGAPALDADLGWNVQGLRSRVVHGEEGWSAVVYVPWRGLAGVRGAERPPRAGEAWRFNVFRIKRPHGPDEPERGAVYAAWSPVPGASFHVPEVFGWMRFTD